MITNNHGSFWSLLSQNFGWIERSSLLLPSYTFCQEAAYRKAGVLKLPLFCKKIALNVHEGKPLARYIADDFYSLQ